MNILIEILIKGVIPGIVASAIYAFFMWILSPRVKISPYMCFFKENGEIVHRIKVTNRSHARLINVTYALYYIRLGEDDLNKIEEVKQLEESYKHTDFDKFSKKNTDYAVRIKYIIDTDKYKLDKNCFFQFKITVMRSYSNRIKCFKQNFHLSDVKHGHHEKAEKLGFYLETN